jgi:hypothetical protein
MPDASQVFTVTAPAGNGSTTSAYYPLAIGLAEVVNCIITWPAGCAGLVGVVLMAANSPAFPRQQNTYLAFDDYVYEFGVTNQIQTGDWGLQIYNADYFNHTIQVVLEYDYVTTTNQLTDSLQVSV